MYKTFLSFIILGLILMNCGTKKNNKKEITSKIKKEIRKEHQDNNNLITNIKWDKNGQITTNK